MAIFIPEWIRISGRRLHVKRALNALDDEYVVRRPLRPGAAPADLFIAHATLGWLALALEEAPYAQIAPAQLFESEQRTRFMQRIAALQGLGTSSEPDARGPTALLLMWACNDAEVRSLTQALPPLAGIRLVSRDQFAESGAQLVKELLTPLTLGVEQSLLGTYFPEAEIPAICTTRRFFRRDNSARLGRFFLDVDQEWAAKLDLDMPADATLATRDFTVRLVNGVAGSGKTLIALHRALLLAELFPRQGLLVLVHNTPIVADLKDRLHRMHGGLPANLEVNTFFGWAAQQWRRSFRTRLQIPDNPRLVPNLVKQHRTQWQDLGPSDAQLSGEIDFINEALITDETGYLAISRAGRGFALKPQERSQIWALRQSVTTALKEARLRMWSAVPRDICVNESGHQRLRKYHHILIDEAQFFAPSWFEVVKLSMESHGQMFLCADPNQGFMKSRLSWKSAGLDVSGRTRKLRKSYRTTRAILEAANSVLAALGQADDEDYLEPDFDGMIAGARPLLVYTDSPQDSMDRVVNELAAIAGKGATPLGAMLLIYGSNIQKSALYKKLCKRFGESRVWWFNEANQKKAPPAGYGRDYLRMAYLETATGLEGGIVFLVGVEALFRQGSHPSLGEEEQHAAREENARKLYMAMTRAGQRLVLIASQRLPAAIERLFEVAA